MASQTKRIEIWKNEDWGWGVQRHDTKVTTYSRLHGKWWEEDSEEWVTVKEAKRDFEREIRRIEKANK